MMPRGLRGFGPLARGWFAGLFLPLRLRHGMFWRRSVPSLDELIDRARGLVVALAIIALVLSALAVADLVTRLGDLEAEVAAASARAEKTSATLADCMNGRARFLHPNNSGRGHGMTAVICEPAYSVDI